MNQHVETILKAALLEKQELEMMLSPLHAHEVINNVAAKFELQLSDKNGKVEINLEAANDLIDADENHFTNLINNLIDNAVKYGKENVSPLIKISSSNNKQGINIKIEDNGIGMNRETVKRIFERFYRAHTGNIHNVKGFGLGLSYVKTVLDAHGGKMKVESAIGKGSSFSMDLPLHKNTTAK
jgi:two-component system, OmpR family, phosphate regulon sensor histidine kinase PhoR